MTKFLTCLSITAAAVCSMLAASQPAVSTPPGYVQPTQGTPIYVAPQYGSGIGYSLNQSGTASAADFKRLIEVNEEAVAELKGTRAELTELKETVRGIAGKIGAPVPQFAPKGLSLLDVVKADCASCHRPGKASGDFVIVTDDQGTALAKLNNRDRVAVKQQVAEGLMPKRKPGEKAAPYPADRKALFAALP